MRDLKYEHTQQSNMSVDYITEKDILERIYNRLNEENQQARAKQRKEAGNSNNLFLTNLGNGGAKKDGAQKEVVDKILR
jgi:hypothetical protein